MTTTPARGTAVMNSGPLIREMGLWFPYAPSSVVLGRIYRHKHPQTSLLDVLLVYGLTTHGIGIVGVLVYDDDTGPRFHSGPRRPSVSLAVRATHRRRGIGTQLLSEALRLWPELRLEEQDTTQAGQALVDAVQARRAALTQVATALTARLQEETS